MVSKITRGFISVLGSKLTALLVSVIATPVFVRILSSSEYGNYAFILSIIGTLFIIVDSGIFDGMRKFIAENNNDEQWKNGIFGFYFLVGMVLAIITGIFIIIITRLGFINRVLGSKFRLYFYLLCILLVFKQLFMISRSALMGLRLEHHSESLKILQQFCFIVGAVSLAYIGFGVPGILLGHILSNIVAGLIGLYLISKKINIFAVDQIPYRSLPRRKLLSFNFLSVILILLVSSLYHVDIILLRLLVGGDETGFYKAIFLIAGPFIWIVPTAIQTVFLQSSSELESIGELEDISHHSKTATRYVLAFTVLLSIGLVLLSEPFIELYYGEQYVVASTALILLLPGSICISVARPILAIGQGLGQLRLLIYSTTLAALINLILNILLIPRYSIEGAALATSLGYASMLLLHIITAKKIGYQPIKNSRYTGTLISGIITLVIMKPFSSLLGDLTSLLIIPPITTLLYMFIIIKIGILPLSEIRSIVSTNIKSVR